MHGVTPINTMSLQEKLSFRGGWQEFCCSSYRNNQQDATV